MNPLAIFSGPYALLARWAVIGALGLAIFITGWVKGNQHGSAKLDNYIAKEAAESVRIAKGRTEVTERVIDHYITRVVPQTRLVTQTVEKEVIKYAESNPGYCLDAGWGRLHDKSALNISDAPGRTDDPGGAPKAAAAIATVTGNYAICHETEDRLTALQEWVRQQQAVR